MASQGGARWKLLSLWDGSLTAHLEEACKSLSLTLNAGAYPCAYPCPGVELAVPGGGLPTVN